MKNTCLSQLSKNLRHVLTWNIQYSFEQFELRLNNKCLLNSDINLEINLQ